MFRKPSAIDDMNNLSAATAYTKRQLCADCIRYISYEHTEFCLQLQVESMNDI